MVEERQSDKLWNSALLTFLETAKNDKNIFQMITFGFLAIIY